VATLTAAQSRVSRGDVGACVEGATQLCLPAAADA
jgi:hypothetical protein